MGVLSVMIKRCVEWCIVLTPTMDCAQTERRWRCPWCGDDVDALGWGAAAPWAMVEWQIHRLPWLTPKFSIILAEEGSVGLVQLYIGYCRNKSHVPK